MALENHLESLEKMPEQIEKLKIWTSNSSESRFHELLDADILPIIIIGISKNSPLINWRNTMIHFLDLGPDSELWKEYKNGNIDKIEFQKKYLNQLWRTSDVLHTLEKFEILTHLSHAKGICILGGISEEVDITRETIAEYFNRTGILENKVCEWKN